MDTWTKFTDHLEEEVNVSKLQGGDIWSQLDSNWNEFGGSATGVKKIVLVERYTNLKE